MGVTMPATGVFLSFEELDDLIDVGRGTGEAR
jgi:hypothetical protein